MQNPQYSTSSVSSKFPATSFPNLSFGIPLQNTQFYHPYTLPNTATSFVPIPAATLFSSFSLPAAVAATLQSSQKPRAQPKVLPQTVRPEITKTSSQNRVTLPAVKTEGRFAPKLLPAIVPKTKRPVSALVGAKIVKDKDTKLVKLPQIANQPDKSRKRKRETSEKEYVTPTTSPATSPERIDTDEIEVNEMLITPPRPQPDVPAVKPHKPHVNIRIGDLRRTTPGYVDEYTGKMSRVGSRFQAEIPELLQNLSQGKWSDEDEEEKEIVMDSQLQEAADSLLHLGDLVSVKPEPKTVGDSGEKVVRSVLQPRHHNIPESPKDNSRATYASENDADMKTLSSEAVRLSNMEAECKPVRTNFEESSRNMSDLCFPEAVRGIRKQKQKLQYLIKWRGFKTLSWEPADSFSEDPAFQDMVESFKQRRANRSRTRSRRSRYPRSRRRIVDGTDEV